jgi:hypothetical protein
LTATLKLVSTRLQKSKVSYVYSIFNLRYFLRIRLIWKTVPNWTPELRFK